MNKKQKIKLYLVAALLGAGLAFEITRSPAIVSVEAEERENVTIQISITPTAIPTPTAKPTAVPEYNYSNVKAYFDSHYGHDAKRDGYIDYVWSKWAGDGVDRQVEALCTNFAEGHFTDEATNDNGSEGVDRGCWQWNDYYNPGVTDEMARNCFTATDLTYNKWVSRGYSFAGYWYGFGSDNYYRCLNIISY